MDHGATDAVHKERVKLPAYLKIALLEETINLNLESESYPKMLTPLTGRFGQPQCPRPNRGGGEHGLCAFWGA